MENEDNFHYINISFNFADLDLLLYALSFNCLNEINVAAKFFINSLFLSCLYASRAFIKRATETIALKNDSLIYLDFIYLLISF